MGLLGVLEEEAAPAPAFVGVTEDVPLVTRETVELALGGGVVVCVDAGVMEDESVFDALTGEGVADGVGVMEGVTADTKTALSESCTPLLR